MFVGALTAATAIAGAGALPWSGLRVRLFGSAVQVGRLTDVDRSARRTRGLGVWAMVSHEPPVRPRAMRTFPVICIAGMLRAAVGRLIDCLRLPAERPAWSCWRRFAAKAVTSFAHHR